MAYVFHDEIYKMLKELDDCWEHNKYSHWCIGSSIDYSLPDDRIDAENVEDGKYYIVENEMGEVFLKQKPEFLPNEEVLPVLVFASSLRLLLLPDPNPIKIKVVE